LYVDGTKKVNGTNKEIEMEPITYTQNELVKVIERMEKRKMYNLRWREKNMDKVKEYQKEWRKKRDLRDREILKLEREKDKV